MLSLDGGPSRLENVEPYAVFGDIQGDFQGGVPLADGAHTFSVDVFAGPGASGGIVRAADFSFTVAPAPAPSPTPTPTPSPAPAEPLARAFFVDPTNDSPLVELGNGPVVLPQAAFSNVGLVVEPTQGLTPESAVLLLTGSSQASRVENVAPYSLFGDIGGDIFGGQVGLGPYSLEVQWFDADGGQGNLLGQARFDFTLGLDNV